MMAMIQGTVESYSKVSKNPKAAQRAEDRLPRQGQSSVLTILFARANSNAPAL